jgi:hypothetical protein
MAAAAQLRTYARKLAVGEPVLNLSNRGALYGYLGWRNPMGYLAPYNIESTTAELRVVSTLQRTQPAYAFVAPGPQFDGVSLTLRDPLLARWVMDHYTPLPCGPTTWATWGVGTAASGPRDLECDPPAAGTPTDAPNVWATSIGAPTDIGMIPFSWGSRTSGLDDGAVEAVKSTGSAADPAAESFELRLPNDQGKSAGGKGGLLELDATCPTNTRAGRPSTTRSAVWGTTEATIAWGMASPRSANSTSTFQWGRGGFVVPLDAYPTWYLGQAAPSTLTLTVPTVDCSGGWHIVSQLRTRQG